MKAPDKIYLGVGPMSGDEPNKRYIYAEWNEEPRSLVQNIAYIRKDALLEYLNGLDTSSRYEQFVIDNLINHIESL